MFRKLLTLVSLGIFLATTAFHAVQHDGDAEEALYLPIPAPGPGWETFLSLANPGPDSTNLAVEMLSRTAGGPAVVRQRALAAGGVWSFEIPNTGPDGRTLRLRASGRMDAVAIVGSRDGHVAEVISATRPLRELAFPLLPAPQGTCTPSFGSGAVHLQLFNPGSQEARVQARGLASDGREVGAVSLPPLLPQEGRRLEIAEIFGVAPPLLASIRLSSDQPLVGLQWRLTEGDLAALPGLQAAQEWLIPPSHRQNGPIAASLWLFNPGNASTTLSIKAAHQGTAPVERVSLRPGEAREVAAAEWIQEGIRVRSDRPVAVYLLYRSATGCGWATASAWPGAASPLQPIEVEASPDGNRLVAWPSFFLPRNIDSESQTTRYRESGDSSPAGPEGFSDPKSVIIAPAAVTDETLSFRHPVDQVSVSASCGLGGTCAGSDTDRHTAVDYDTRNANPPAFASSFGVLRRTIGYNENVGCTSLSCTMGNSVVIEYLQTNGEKWLSVDSHLASRAVTGTGSRIVKGQAIGIVGCSGTNLCSWCTNSTTSCTAYGDGTSYNKHAHHEHKLPDLGTVDLWPYGYMNSTEANQLRKPNEGPISIAEAISRAFTTVDGLRSRGIRVLVPFFSPFVTSPGLANYEVYGIAGSPLNATIVLAPTTARTFTNIGVGGRVWNNESADADLFIRSSESISANQTRTLSGSRTLTAGDYSFFAYIERHQEKSLGRGYSLKLTVLPNANSRVVDNESRVGYTASEGGAQTVPGYYLSGKLFQGGSGNWAQWRPGRSGLFEIWAHIPPGATASRVSYKIYTDSSRYILSDPVNQANNNDRWVKLTSGSTQSWALSSSGYIGLSLENVPGSEKAGADAIKFIDMGGIPAAPSNLRASTDSTLRANLSWSDNSSNETGFKIDRKTGATGSWSQRATAGAGATGYADSGLSPSTTYVYRVRATNNIGDSAYSNEASATTGAGSCSSSTSTISPGRSLGGTLSTTDCFSTVRTSSYHDRFTFAATARVSYVIAMTSSSFDTYLVLKNPSGTVVATNDDADSSTNSRIIYTATTSGTYVIEATSFTSRATGSYTVSLSTR